METVIVATKVTVAGTRRVQNPTALGETESHTGRRYRGENTEREEGLCWIRGVTIDQTRSGTREQRDQTQEANLVLSVKSNSKHVSSQ